MELATALLFLTVDFISGLVDKLVQGLFTNLWKPKSTRMIFVWLDQHHDQHFFDLLKRTNENEILIFDSIDKCLEGMNHLNDQNRTMSLITSGSLGISIIPLVHSLYRLDSIIVFCHDISNYEFMTRRYQKIRGVYNTFDQLFIELQTYLQQTLREQSRIEIFDIEQLKLLRHVEPDNLSYTVFNEKKQYSIHHLSNADTFFLWLKLLTNVLPNVRHTNATISEMLSECRKYYSDNENELNRIDEFERTYSKDRAIQWYTSQTFVSKMINKALKTEDIRALYICRAYIADLSEQLHHEYEEYKQLFIELEQPLPQWIVSHGRAMSKDEIDLLCNKKGQLILINGFLSTSRKKNVADLFSHQVRFIIETSFELSYGCFAHVAPMSEFPDEDEVLFDLASVFKLVDFQYNYSEEKWNFYFQATDESTQMVQSYVDAVKIEANEMSTDFIFARLLIQMGQYSLAEDYLTKLFESIELENEENRDLALTYYYRGLNFFRQGNYAQAMVDYERALDIQRRIFPEGHSDLGETLGGIGLIHDITGNYEIALNYHFEGLHISEKVLPNDHVHIAESLHNIGLCYDRMGNFQLAMEYDVRALEMKQRLFPYDHPDIATSLNNIGLAYYNHLEFEKALDYHEKALAMKERCLPNDHPELAISYCNLGLVHLALNHFDQAIVFHLKDLAMSERTLSADHVELGITHHNLGQVYRAKDKSNDLALRHYRKAIEIYSKTLPRQHPYIGQSMMFMAEILAEQEILSEAIHLAEEAVHILQATLPEKHLRHAEALYILARIYKQTGQYQMALNYANQALQIQSTSLDDDHKDLQKTRSLIASL